jgi:hypothetical protein
VSPRTSATGRTEVQPLRRGDRAGTTQQTHQRAVSITYLSAVVRPTANETCAPAARRITQHLTAGRCVLSSPVSRRLTMAYDGLGLFRRNPCPGQCHSNLEPPMNANSRRSRQTNMNFVAAAPCLAVAYPRASAFIRGLQARVCFLGSLRDTACSEGNGATDQGRSRGSRRVLRAEPRLAVSPFVSVGRRVNIGLHVCCVVRPHGGTK